MTMTLVSTTTVGSGGAANITFSSIPQTGTDLLVVLSGRVTTDGAVGIYFNGSNSSLTNRFLRGSGSAASSNSASVIGYIGESSVDGQTANTFGNVSVYIPNYTGSTNKSFSVDAVSENNATSAYQTLVAGLWSSTAAITSLTLLPASSATFKQYSTASLYTITKGSGGATVS